MIDFNFQLVRLRRKYMRCVLANAVEWSPLTNGADSEHTIILGANHQLLPLVAANLRFLSRQVGTGLREILLVIDHPITDELQSKVREITCRFPLPIRTLWYTERQARLARFACTAWAYSWLSWSIGISEATTRFAMLHDLDCMLIHPTIVEDRFGAIAERGDQYLGHRFYGSMGVEVEDQLAATYELAFDVQFVRQRFRPIDLFNKATIRQNRRIHYDTFLWAQHQCGSSSILPISEEHMVHPSQMICQFTELIQGNRQPARQPNLPLMAYFFELGGEPSVMHEQTRWLQSNLNDTLPFFGKTLQLKSLQLPHVVWLRKQADRLEQALYGRTRTPVSDFFNALEAIPRRKELNA